MPSGTIKKLNEKGFGFIDYGNGKDVFFHVSGLQDRSQFENLQVGDQVDFNLEINEDRHSDDRPRAIDVVVTG